MELKESAYSIKNLYLFNHFSYLLVITFTFYFSKAQNLLHYSIIF
jgi:hypothetical protein